VLSQVVVAAQFLQHGVQNRLLFIHVLCLLWVFLLLACFVFLIKLLICLKVGAKIPMPAVPSTKLSPLSTWELCGLYIDSSMDLSLRKNTKTCIFLMIPRSDLWYLTFQGEYSLYCYIKHHNYFILLGNKGPN